MRSLGYLSTLLSQQQTVENTHLQTRQKSRTMFLDKKRKMDLKAIRLLYYEVFAHFGSKKRTLTFTFASLQTSDLTPFGAKFHLQKSR